jgi:hypothetical protein
MPGDSRVAGYPLAKMLVAIVLFEPSLILVHATVSANWACVMLVGIQRYSGVNDSIAFCNWTTAHAVRSMRSNVATSTGVSGIR